MKTVLKNLLFLTLILGFSFGGGFYFGAFPDALMEHLGLYKGKLRWICTTDVCPSHETLLKIQEQTQVEFQMIENIDSAEDLRSTSIRADVITANRPMLTAIKEELAVFPDKVYSSKLHPDFDTFISKDKVGLPLFWKVIRTAAQERSTIRIFSVGFFLESRLSEQQKDILIQSFMDSDIQLQWMKEKSLATSLIELDQSKDLKPEDKPSFLRTFRLTDILIEE